MSYLSPYMYGRRWGPLFPYEYYPYNRWRVPYIIDDSYYYRRGLLPRRRRSVEKIIIKDTDAQKNLKRDINIVEHKYMNSQRTIMSAICIILFLLVVLYVVHNKL